MKVQQKAEERINISKEEPTPFLAAVAELAKSRGFEVAEVKDGILKLNLEGKFAAMVDESGSMGYHPYNEVFDIMGEVSKLRKSIPIEEPEQGMQMNM